MHFTISPQKYNSLQKKSASISIIINKFYSFPEILNITKMYPKRYIQVTPGVLIVTMI